MAQCKNGGNVLGIFPLQPNFEPFNVSPKNSQLFYEFCLANGIETKVKEEAKMILLERDHFDIYQLTKRPYEPGMIGARFVPPIFVSKVLTERGEIIGETAERELYEGLKKYFDETKDNCLILYGHSFLHDENLQEKVSF